MATSCYTKTNKSSKPPLPEEKITLLEGECLMCILKAGSQYDASTKTLH